METQEATILSREELVHLALMAVCSCDYYDLVDYIDITSDDDLWQIIENRDIRCENCR